MVPTEKLALSIDEVATLLGVSKPTVYDLIHRDGFPSFKVGRRTLVSRSRLTEWVDLQATGGRDAL